MNVFAQFGTANYARTLQWADLGGRGLIAQESRPPPNAEIRRHQSNKAGRGPAHVEQRFRPYRTRFSDEFELSVGGKPNQVSGQQKPQLLEQKAEVIADGGEYGVDGVAASRNVFSDTKSRYDIYLPR